MFNAEFARTLATVIDEGSLEAAARRLHLTPSAVSQRIKALEESVGRVLIVRSKPVRPTAAAEPVVRFARQLALIQHDAMTALAGEELVSIPLAVNADSLATWFLEPLARLTRRTRLVFDLHRDDQDFTAGLLESGTVMGAVTSRAEPVAGCRAVPLGAMRYEAVAAPDFAERWWGARGDAAPSLDALASAPRVDFDRRDDLQRRWLELRGAADDSGPRHFVPASHDFAEAVLRGLGWGLLPAVQSAQALTEGSLVRLGGPPIDVKLSWQQWNLQSPLLDLVAEEIVAEGTRVLARVG
ncbi:LysR family transcriptional regulator ArgP [Microbacterium sp. TNHR37B]|uniref:LysR family transcriptional regulator ArgP n=1 Tax=Microbacterium sp. TNHR37B TaxID=1775956 RepID=UPI0007B1A9CF|nr:LysR family transcriptional regulator ArgP [Microbacterium sp. TNHR37B]KZE91906.1 putative HTH-type transcriptional regulator [Microbacterium sp. TNHR37B]